MPIAGTWRRSTPALLVSLAMLGMAFGSLIPLSPPVAGQTNPRPTTETPRGRTSSCAGSAATDVITSPLRVCDQTTITATASAICPLCPGGVNMFIVLQRWTFESHWMAREAISILEELELWQKRNENGPVVRVSVIVYDHEGASVLVSLTDNIRSARSKVSNVPGFERCLQGTPCLCFAQLGNPSRVAGLISAMLRDLQRDLNLSDDDPGCNFAVLFSQHGFGDSCLGFPLGPDTNRAIRAAQQIARQVGTMLVGCTSTVLEDCEGTSRMAQKASYFSQALRANQLRRTLKSLLSKLEDPRLLREVVLTQHLPPSLDYVAASASISPTTLITATDGTTLTWEWKGINVAGPYTVSYRVDPSALGVFTVTGAIDILDTTNRHRIVPFDDVALRVEDPCEPPATATPTPTDTPLPTATPTITPTPTSTATPTPTPTATPKPGPIYLPIALSERCDQARRSSDVALVIDASTSMLEDTGTGRTKMAAALAATRKFLDLMSLDVGLNRAAIVVFNSEARVMEGLTSDRTRLEAALDAIVPAPQTCLPCAIDTAETALGTPIAGRTRTIVLLTDGRSNPQPVEDAVTRAAAAKANGVIIASVGLGNDLELDALRRIATSDKHAFQSPNAADLEAIYTAIASLIPCPTFRPEP